MWAGINEFAENDWTEIREDQPGGSIIVPTTSGRLQILELRSGGSLGGQYRNVFKPLYGKQRHWAGTD